MASSGLLSRLPVPEFRGVQPLIVAAAGLAAFLITRFLPFGGGWGPTIRMVIVIIAALVAIRALVADHTWQFLPARAPFSWLAAFGLGVGGILIAQGLPMLLAGGWLDVETNRRLASAFLLGDDPGLNQALVIGAVVAAPIAAELAFRGMGFAGLRNGLAEWFENVPAVVIAAVVAGIGSALVQGSASMLLLIGLAVAGVWWGLTYHLTGSLLVTVGSYAASNAWLMWTLLHGPNAVAAGDGSTMAMIVVGPFAAIGVARLLGRMIAVGTEPTG